MAVKEEEYEASLRCSRRPSGMVTCTRDYGEENMPVASLRDWFELRPPHCEVIIGSLRTCVVTDYLSGHMSCPIRFFIDGVQHGSGAMTVHFMVEQQIIYDGQQVSCFFRDRRVDVRYPVPH